MTYIPETKTKISTNNSATSTSLAASSTLSGVGTGEDVSIYGSIVLSIYSDQSSAGGGIKIEFSQDGTNWDISTIDTYVAGSAYSRTFPVRSQYYRMTYTNGSSAATVVRVQSMLHPLVKNKTATDGSQVISLDPRFSSAFSRIRTAEPYTLFQSTHISDSGFFLIFQKITGQGSITRNANDSSVDMVISGASSTITRQSRYLGYQPGKSLLILVTGNLESGDIANTAGVTSRIGFFDDDDGVFFSRRIMSVPLGLKNSVNSVVLRSKTSGSVVDTIVESTSWNLDRMDGTGPSGITLDFTKSQIFVIDLEWLGVGVVRMGFSMSGSIFYVHQFINSNDIKSTYMSRASLPIRYQLASDSTETVSGEMKHICSTAISEGGHNPRGRPRSISNGVGSISANNTTETPLVAIRIEGVFFPKTYVSITGLSVMSVSNQAVLFRLRYYQSYSGANTPIGTAAWTIAGSGSFVEYQIGPGTAFDASGSIVLQQEYLTGASSNLDQNISTDVFLTYDLLNARYGYIVLTAQSLSGTPSVVASINWQEYE
jgi:hypothetical protein